MIFVTVHNGLHRSIRSQNCISNDKNNQIPQIESGNPVQSQPASKEMISDSVEKSVSYTSNLLEQMYDYRIRIMFHPKWILNLQDLLQNRSLETVPACTVSQYYPNSNTVCIHMCDECNISIDSGVCDKLWSIL